MSGRSDYSSYTVVLSIFNLDFTFDQCITSDLTALTRLLLQYTTPLYFMILLIIILTLTKLKGFSKYLGNHSILQALWLLVLLSYLNISNSTFEILHCHVIGPIGEGKVSKFVLVYDANVQCWSGIHLVWSILAILLATIFILPFPLYIVLAIKIPKLKPITDVYTSIYKDSQRYWVCWNLLRRILIVLLTIFVVDFVYRHFSLLLASLLVLVIFVITRPYRYKLDNFYGGMVSFGILLFCVVTQPLSYIYFDPHRVISWLIVAIVIITGLMLLMLEGVLELFKRKDRQCNKDELLDFLRGSLLKMNEKVKRSNKYSMELSESTGANDYYGVSRHVYSEYREPLLDSVSYGHSIVESNRQQKLSESEHETSVTPINATSTVVSVLTNSNV